MTTPLEMPLEERGEALASVDALLADAHAGKGRLLVLEGPAGIGKTRLLAAIQERARGAGMRTLRARAGELEQDFPFGVVRQLFEASLSGPARDELLSGAADLARPVFEVGETAGSSAAEPAYGTLHGLYWLTVNFLESGPALLSVDDLPWCDPASQRYLAYLVRRLDGLGVLVVATMRPRTVSEPGLIDEITDSLDATVIRLSPLSSDAVAALLAVHFGPEPDPEFSSTVSDWTAGNPLLLRELIAAVAVRRIEATRAGAQRVRELAPEGVGRLVLRRIAPLGPDARAVAEAIAVLGEDAELGRTAELAGLSRVDALRSMNALRGIDVVSREDRPAFAHPLVRRAIYDDMDVARRETLHVTAAALLAREGLPPSRVVAHLLAVSARSDPAVVASLREAARQAVTQGAPDAAVTYLTRALAEPPGEPDRMPVTLELGVALAQARPAEAVPHLIQVIDGTDDDAMLAEAVLALGQGPLDSYAEWMPIALRVLDRITAEQARRRVEAHYLFLGGYRPDHYPAAKSRLDRVTVVGGDDPVSRILVGLQASHAAREGVRPEAALELARAALAGEVLIRSNNSAFGLPINVLIHLDRFDEALGVLDTALEHARRTGSLPMFAVASWLRAQTLLGCGDLAGAAAETPVELDADPVRITGMRMGADVLGEVALHHGDLAAAAQHLDYSQELEEPSVWGWAINRSRRGRLRAAQGRLGDALDDLRTAGEWLRALGCANPAYCPWRSEAALVLARLERREEALVLAFEEVELARTWTAPRTLGNALCAAGLITGGEDGIDLLREANVVLADSPAALARARAAIELGAALRRANHRAEARAPLALGLELAERCGATAQAGRAREELIATGARPRRAVRTGVDALTATELRVARLAAEGLTNREAAQALFVTPKTIEIHLSHSYAKLGLKSRSQLREALAVREPTARPGLD